MINTREISKYEGEILINLINMFSNKFIEEINNITDTLKGLKIDNIKRNLPSPFCGNNSIALEVLVSLEKKSMLFNFKSSNEEKLEIIEVEGERTPLNLINIGNDNTFEGIVNIKNSNLNGLLIEYGFILSFNGFGKRIVNIKEFALDFINSNRDLNNYKNENDKIEYIYYLKKVKEEFLKLISDENTPELVIDKFLEDNNIILQRGLHLDKFMHQVVMKNLLGKYEHDLKPDLIAYDVLNNKWVIVDYKKAKKSLIKNLNKVRTGFKADINDLENQLLDYIEYFEEEEHREYIKNEYKCDLKYPDAIGIIGSIKAEEQVAFNRLMKNKPRWFSVMPYNYLYDSFCRYVEHVEKF